MPSFILWIKEGFILIEILGGINMNKNWSIDTICVQGDYNPEKGEPRVLPLYQSTTYKYSSSQELADLFDLKSNGHMYSRISNPTVDAFEKKVCLLEGGVGAMATASGQSATLNAILNICSAGDHIISSSSIYGGTLNLLSVTLKKLGIDISFVDSNAKYEDIIKYSRPNTKCIFGETIGNPSLKILNFAEFSKASKIIDVPFIVDNTFATPILCNPLKLGANIVIHSTTKYIDGHASSVGGIIIDGGNFNWDNGKFNELIVPDESYHGVCYVKDFGNSAYITKARVQLLRDLGNCLSPFNAYLTNMGLETLHLRMERHCKNALELAVYLKNHPCISWVNYPLLEDSSEFNLAQKYLSKGASGVLTFGVKGGKEAAENFINKLELAALVVHVADLRSSVIHPASTTHRQLTEEQQIAAGVNPDLIRFSVGIENIEDIKNDINNALRG